MIEWRLERACLPDRWNVVEYSGAAYRRYIATSIDEPTARRIAKLLELETIVDLAIVWQKSFVHGRDVTDEGLSIADEAAEHALYEAAEAAGEEAGS